MAKKTLIYNDPVYDLLGSGYFRKMARHRTRCYTIQLNRIKHLLINILCTFFFFFCCQMGFSRNFPDPPVEDNGNSRGS